MLLTREVEVKLYSKKIKYYEDLGYEINRLKHNKRGYEYVPIGTKISVKTEDLPNGSIEMVDVKCDCETCNNPYLKPMKWRNYKRYVKDDGKYYCLKCSLELYGAKNRIKNILKNGKSFEQWCIENNRYDVLDRWDYELNNYKPSEVLYASNKTYYFKCPRALHESECKRLDSFVKGQEGSMYCRQCNSFAQWGIDNIREDFLEKYWDYEKNNELNINPWEISYGSEIDIFIRCQNKEKHFHGSYFIKCFQFCKGSRCPYCSNMKVHYQESLGVLYPKVLNLWSDKNKKTPYEYYPNSGQYVWWKCPEGKHDGYLREIRNSNRCNFTCSECAKERDESYLQEKVRKYIECFNYTILHERKCTIIPRNPKIKNKHGQLPFDNEIKELKLIIEVHGLQHYELCGFHQLGAKYKNTTAEQEFHFQKLKDRYKRIVAKSHGYNFLEIPYWTDNKEEDWKKLIDEKIKSIKSNIILDYV